MAQQDEGSKTELPTAKRLRDARKKGDVAKSPDVGITLGFLFSVLLLWLVFDMLVTEVMSLTTHVLESPSADFTVSLRRLSEEAIDVFVRVTGLIVIPLALFGLLVEFLVVGPVFTAEKFTPNLSHMNAFEGLKRMFGKDNLVELIKSVLKTALLVFIVVYVVKSAIGDLVLLPNSSPDYIIEGLWFLLVRVFGYASALFILLMFFDSAYQKHSFTDKMKMSIRDIRDEHKNMEGDPMMKGVRRDLAHEWANEAPTQAARDANVLIVNPTHVAIAIRYDAEETKIPMITGRGEEETARKMRYAASEAGVPVLRNEQLARALLATDEIEEFVPKEFFEIIAEVILWAAQVSEQLNGSAKAENHKVEMPPPGEDLTTYHHR